MRAAARSLVQRELPFGPLPDGVASTEHEARPCKTQATSPLNREFRMRKPSTITGWTTAALAVSVAGIATLGWLWTKPAAAQTSAPDPVVYLDQAWSQADRERYYQILARLERHLVRHLPQPRGRGQRRSSSGRTRTASATALIPQAANPRTNPDGLPIGLAKTSVPKATWKGEYVGLNCAACHNAELTYKGKTIRVDGGVGNTFDFMAYIYGLDDALQATLSDAGQVRSPGGATRRASPEAQGDIAQALRERRQARRTSTAHASWSRPTMGPGRAWMPSARSSIA